MERRHSLHFKAVLRLLSLALYALAVFAPMIGYLAHNLAYFAPARSAMDAVSYSAPHPHSPASVELPESGPDVRPFIWVCIIATGVGFVSSIYLFYTLQESILRFSLADMTLANVAVFWSLCFAYIAEAGFSLAAVRAGQGTSLATIFYHVPYLIFGGVYFWLSFRTHAPNRFWERDARVGADMVVWNNLAPRVLDLVVLASLFVVFLRAHGSEHPSHSAPTTLAGTVTAKHYAILTISIALLVGYWLRRRIARTAEVWNTYAAHVRHIQPGQRRLADFKLKGECRAIIDIGSGASMRMQDLLRDPRVTRSKGVAVFAIDRLFTDARSAEYRQDLQVVAGIAPGSIKTFRGVGEFLDHPGFASKVVGGQGYVLLYVSHALYYRNLAKELERVIAELTQIEIPFVCVVRGSGLKSLWSVAAATMSLRALGASAAMFWRKHHLPVLCEKQDLDLLLRAPRRSSGGTALRKSRWDALQDIGLYPDDVLDQRIEWNELSAMNSIELLNSFHGAWVLDAFREIALWLSKLDHHVSVPCEDVQFWLTPVPARVEFEATRLTRRDAHQAGRLLDWNPATRVCRTTYSDPLPPGEAPPSPHPRPLDIAPSDSSAVPV